MRLISGGAFLIFSVLLISEQIINVSSASVTNEEIREAVLSLIHSYSVLDNKLERHEQRERALGEVIKRGLTLLQKNLKTFDGLPDIFRRLDDRVSQIETLLINQDEAFTEIMKLHKNDGRPSKSNDDSEEDDKKDDKFTALAEKLFDSIDSLKKQIEEVKLNTGDASSETMKTTEKLVNSKLAFADEAISRIEEKFSHFYVTGTNGNSNNADWQLKVSETLQTIKDDMEALKKSRTSDKHNGAGTDLTKEFFETLNNETLDAIQDMKLEVLTASDKSFAKTEMRINDASSLITNTIEELGKTMTDNLSTFEEVNEDIKKNLTSVQRNLEQIRQVEKVILQSSEGILGLKKQVEFSVHQVNMAVSDLLAQDSKELNATLTKRFNEIDASILENQNKGLANLSNVIETELGNIWRQIGIMNTDISGSKSALDALQNQTMAYVNGTFSTMDNMGGKVGQITDRMTEVDSNLNYLLGRLSLVTQEFNQIKYGLGTALDNIKASFEVVQNRAKDIAQGPGPHPITQSKEEQGPL